MDDDGVVDLHIEPAGPPDPFPQIHVLEEHEVAVVESPQALPGGRGQQQTGPGEPAHRPRPARAAPVSGVVGRGEGVARPDPAQDGMSGALDQGGQGPPRGVDGAVGVEQQRPQAAGSRVGQARVDERIKAARLPDEVGVGHHDPVLLQVRGRQVGSGPVAEVGPVTDDTGPVAPGNGSDDVVLRAVVRDDDREAARRRRLQRDQEALQLLTRVEGHRHHTHALLVGGGEGGGQGTGWRRFHNIGHGKSLAP